MNKNKEENTIMVYGYARCSTDELRQDIDRQKRELRKLGVILDEHIYWEYESGIKEDRAELKKLLSIVKPGDSIAVTEVSRLTRSMKQLCEIFQFIKDHRLRLVIGSFVIDCSTTEIDPMTKGMLMMWGVFAEMERDIISQRVRSGIVNARIKGKKIGRPKTTLNSLPDKFWKYYNMYDRHEITVSEMAKLMGTSRTTIYKYIDTVRCEQ